MKIRSHLHTIQRGIIPKKAANISAVCVRNVLITTYGFIHMDKFRVSVAFAVMTIMFISALSLIVDDVSAESNECGDSLTWDYDTGTKTLTVSGSGEMWNYDGWGGNPSNYAPWNSLTILSVVIEDGVTSISDSAFFFNWSITSISLPNSLLYIGDSAFSMCSISTVTIPENVNTVGYSAFSGCTSLERINVTGPNFISDDGVLYSGDGRTLICYPAGRQSNTYSILEGTTTIAEHAFYCCELLTSVTIPEGVITIGNEAFTICELLASVTIPNSMESIGDHAFGGCISLTEIRIPANIASIGNSAFALGSNSSHVTCEVHTTTEGILDAYGNAYTTFQYIIEPDDDGNGDNDDNKWYMYAIGVIVIFVIIVVALLMIKRSE